MTWVIILLWLCTGWLGGIFWIMHDIRRNNIFVRNQLLLAIQQQLEHAQRNDTTSQDLDAHFIQLQENHEALLRRIDSFEGHVVNNLKP
jgi:uncharacterized protein HemX